jgi:hypothetical protein
VPVPLPCAHILTNTGTEAGATKSPFPARTSRHKTVFICVKELTDLKPVMQPHPRYKPGNLGNHFQREALY